MKIKTARVDAFGYDLTSYSVDGFLSYYGDMTEAEAERRLDALKDQKSKTAKLLRATIQIRRAETALDATRERLALG